MMNYMEQFRREAEPTMRPLKDAVDSAARQRASVEKRLAEEQSRLTSAERHGERLNALAGEQLGGSKADYTRFQNRLKKHKAQLAAAQECVAKLRDDILPRLVKEHENAREKLRAALQDFVLRRRPQCEQDVTKVVDQAIVCRDRFLDAADQIHRDFGLTFARVPKAYPRLCHVRLETGRATASGKPPALHISHRPEPPASPAPAHDSDNQRQLILTGTTA